LGLSAAARPGA